MTYLGYPNTTGLRTMDYRIVDALTDPVNVAEKFSTEKLLRTEGCFICFNSLDKENIFPAVNIPFNKNKYITFGSFNDTTKLNNSVLKVWSQILLELPNSKLLIKTKGMDKSFKQIEFLSKMKHFGIDDSSRIIFAGRVASRHEHLKYYNNIDIALDTFPYNGTTTTMQALSMGVSVIVLIGNSHHSRVGFSLLKHAGLQATI